MLFAGRVAFWVIFKLFKHALFPENQGTYQHQYDGGADNEPEVWKRKVVDVDTVKTEDDVWQRHDHGQRSQRLHHDIHIVVDDGGKGIHGVGKDVGVNRAHFDRLFDLDDDVLQKLFVAS